MWIFRYELKPKRALSALAGSRARQGALLRTETGFADIHPWPELGDAPLDEQLTRLARNETTALTAASLRFAALDGEARARGVSLFDGVTIPESHWPGPDPPPEFDTAKIKGADRLPDRVRLRIDFNNLGTPAEVEALPRERIDFVEDPFPYDAKQWRALRERTGLRLALDRGTAEDGVDVLVVKPAVQEVPKTEKEIVVTSYMDHPVGQLGAAYIASKHATSSRCGLITHVLYERDVFIEQLALHGMRLVPPRGIGIGFGDLLEHLPWRRLT